MRRQGEDSARGADKMVTRRPEGNNTFHKKITGGVAVALNSQVVLPESVDVGVTPLVDNVKGVFPEVMSLPGGRL